MFFDGCTGLPSIAYDQLENHKDGTVIYNDYYKLSPKTNMGRLTFN